MTTNHKWNILNIMRFYNRIGKDFSAQTYVRFVTPVEGSHARSKTPVTLPQVNTLIRRHVENKWCERNGELLNITDKGLRALEAWERARNEDHNEKLVDRMRHVQKTNNTARKNKRNKYGQYVKSTED